MVARELKKGLAAGNGGRGACMAAVAPSSTTAERERSAAAPQCQTEHGKAKKGRRNGAGRGQPWQAVLNGHGSSGEGSDRLVPHLSTNSEDDLCSKKQRARRSCWRGGSKRDGAARLERGGQGARLRWRAQPLLCGGEAREDEASGEAERGAARGVGEMRLRRGPQERHPTADAGVRSPWGGRGLSAVRHRCTAHADECVDVNTGRAGLPWWAENGAADQ
jgi:hypothetical protein